MGHGMAALETFPNRHPGRDYTIQHTCPEFTSVCPKTGQPDFGTIRITLRAGPPLRRAQEPEALPAGATAAQGIFYEDVINVILDDLVAARRAAAHDRRGRLQRARRDLLASSPPPTRPPRRAAGESNEPPHHLRRRFVAGERPQDAVRAGERLHAKGIKATFDKLGEDVLDARGRGARDGGGQVELLRLIPTGIERNISIKMSSMGQDISRDLCLENVSGILDCAKAVGGFVRLDMEGSRLTQDTLEIFHELRKRSRQRRASCCRPCSTARPTT